LHGLDDSGVQDHRPKEWNKCLFDQLIPTAWARLLRNICQKYRNQDHSHLWPPNSSNTRQLWTDLCHSVVLQISDNHLPVWYTDAGYIALEHGLLAQKDTHSKEREAFREARLPIIFVKDYVLQEARHRPGSRQLEPRTLHQLLQRLRKEDSLSGPSKVVLLEYLLCGCSTTELQTLKIFPFLDAQFRSLDQGRVFLHRCNIERTLFSRQQNITIDTAKFSKTALQTLRGQAGKVDPLIRFRTSEDLRDYYLRHIANGTGDTIILDDDRRLTLSQVWSWIICYCQNGLPLSALGSLWLVPLRGCTARRLVPKDDSNSVTWFSPGEINDISLDIVASIPEMASKILAVDSFSEDISQGLLRFASKEKLLCIKHGNNFGNYLGFLAQGRTLLQTAADDVKDSAVRALQQLYRLSMLVTRQECSVLKSLCLFKAVKWPANATEVSLTRYWTDMNSNLTFVGLKSLLPVPSSPEHVFIDMTDEGVRRLFEGLELLTCWSDVQLLDNIVVPAMHRGGYNHLSPTLRLEVVDMLFRKHFLLLAVTRSRIPGLEVVPLKKRTDASSLSFARPVDILDPQKPKLKKMYFEDEYLLPEEQFYSRFSAALADYGMVSSLTEKVAIDRIQCFGTKELEFAVVASRAQEILGMQVRGTNNAQLENLTRIARATKWLPARSPNKSNSLVSPSQCRDIRDEPIVSHVWHILPFRVDTTWLSILGWQNAITLDVLISQLAASISVVDIPSVEQTLSYMKQYYSRRSLADQLLNLDFVRSSQGKLVNATKACRGGAEMLNPYLFTVEPQFWDANINIMRSMNISEVPTLAQLKDVQEAIGSRGRLSERDLDVAVEVARIWSVQFPSVEGLKLPDSDRMLRDVSDLAFNDTPWLSQGQCAMVHSNISRNIADKLMVEPLSELLRKGDLGIKDPDDDGFDQREEVADGIRDTLGRYTRESTFHEYLANADDCVTASVVNFLVDGTCHGTRDLITKELEELQGPSLFIHNNGGE
jgi:sacsin